MLSNTVLQPKQLALPDFLKQKVPILNGWGTASGSWPARVWRPPARKARPCDMWKPLSGGGVPLNLFGTGTGVVGGKHAAVFICYEQLLTWPVLLSMFEDPDVIIGVANNHWTSATPIPRCQRESLRLWSALFRIPYLAASNR